MSGASEEELLAQILSIQSFLRGTGKTNLIANLATLLAAEGQRVGVIDVDMQSPGIHVLFGLAEDQTKYKLNDYLQGRCTIEETAHEVTPFASKAGRVFLVPCSITTEAIALLLQEGYEVNRLNDGLNRLIKALRLDVLLIDTHAGLNEETLLAMALSDALGIMMRPDRQDFQGTSVTMEVARKLGVPRVMLVVNQVPSIFDPGEVKKQVADTYQCEVAAVLPHSEELMSLASGGIFVLRYPDHPLTKTLRHIAMRLVF
jgi:septum site-determining protein MinD